MISKIYVIACDGCRKNMQVLKANSIGTAFKAAKGLPWRRNSNNTLHTCPECMAQVKATGNKPREGDAVEAGKVTKKVNPGGK